MMEADLRDGADTLPGFAVSANSGLQPLQNSVRARKSVPDEARDALVEVL